MGLFVNRAGVYEFTVRQAPARLSKYSYRAATPQKPKLDKDVLSDAGCWPGSDCNGCPNGSLHRDGMEQPVGVPLGLGSRGSKYLPQRVHQIC